MEQALDGSRTSGLQVNDPYFSSVTSSSFSRVLLVTDPRDTVVFLPHSTVAQLEQQLEAVIENSMNEDKNLTDEDEEDIENEHYYNGGETLKAMDLDENSSDETKCVIPIESDGNSESDTEAIDPVPRSSVIVKATVVKSESFSDLGFHLPNNQNTNTPPKIIASVRAYERLPMPLEKMNYDHLRDYITR